MPNRALNVLTFNASPFDSKGNKPN